MLTAQEIEKVTDGYVNSGVLRQWVMKGYIEAGPRAKLSGGPRTFTHREGTKAALIAELRRCGISLEVASERAEQISRQSDRRFKKRQAGQPEDRASGIYFVLVNPHRDQVIPLTLSDSRRPFGDLVPEIDSFLVLNYVNIAMRVLKAGRKAGVEEEVSA